MLRASKADPLAAAGGEEAQGLGDEEAELLLDSPLLFNGELRFFQMETINATLEAGGEEVEMKRMD